MVYKPVLWNLPTKVTLFFYLIYLLNVIFFGNFVLFCSTQHYSLRRMVWLRFRKNKLDVKNRKIKNISKIHDFFYEQSNYKIGASENKLQLNVKVNEQQIITNNYLENSSVKFTSGIQKQFSFIHKIPKCKLKFNITKKLVYSLAIFSFLLTFGFVLFFISSSNKSESITFISIEKQFSFTKKHY